MSELTLAAAGVAPTGTVIDLSRWRNTADIAHRAEQRVAEHLRSRVDAATLAQAQARAARLIRMGLDVPGAVTRAVSWALGTTRPRGDAA